MHLPGGHFLNHLRTRIPWVIAIIAVVAAASTGTIWATSRIRSLDTDLSSVGKQSNVLRDRLRRLQKELAEAEAALADARVSNSELTRERRDLLNCVSKSNPGGGPIVTLVPNHGPVGAHVQMVGHCFVGRSWQNKKNSGYRISLVGVIDSKGRATTRKRKAACELVAGADGDLHITPDGRMSGHFIVPKDGSCFQSKRSASTAPGSYNLIIGCHACTVAKFRVTTERAERKRLKACRRGDHNWFLEGPGGATGMLALGVRVEPTRGVSCRFTESLTITIAGPAGISLPIRGNPGSARFDAALGRERTLAAWAWQNWCGTLGPYELRAVLGSDSKTKAFEVSPRCDFERRASRLDPIRPWMDGVASYEP